MIEAQRKYRRTLRGVLTKTYHNVRPWCTSEEFVKRHICDPMLNYLHQQWVHSGYASKKKPVLRNGLWQRKS